MTAIGPPEIATELQGVGSTDAGDVSTGAGVGSAHAGDVSTDAGVGSTQRALYIVWCLEHIRYMGEVGGRHGSIHQ
jgi:hypothetical protein